MQLGDPTASIALHLFVCEVEAKKGFWSHLNVISRLRGRCCQRIRTHGWRDLASICDFCLAYLVGDLVAAERAATDALRLSARSGTHEPNWRHSSTSLIFDSARKARRDKSAVQDAPSRLTKMSPRCREGIFDGLAQLALNRGEFVESERLIGELFTPAFPEHSYPKLWSFPTRVRLHMVRGEWIRSS